MTAPRTTPGQASSAQPTVRRLIVFTLLFVLVIIAASGLSGLLGRLLDTGALLAGDDTAGLAQSLAFTLIGGPFAALLWLFIWRRAGDENERHSVAYGLYIALASFVSLIVFANAMLTTAATGIDGQWLPREFSTGLVWLGVWVWHGWMSRHASRGPARLATVPSILGWVYGLVLAVGAGVATLSALFGEALLGIGGDQSVGEVWWMPALQSLVWAAGGTLIWWWFWVRDSARTTATGFANVALIVVGVLGGSILALVGIGTTVFVLLRLAFDRTEPLRQLLEPLDIAIASAAIGTLVWLYHRRVALGRSQRTRQARTLVTSGVALVATASGIGVIVNATLAGLTPTLAGSDPRTLLLGGIASFLVGAPLWWLVWKPRFPGEPTRAASVGRRVYLIAIFGVSAIVALITLLVIGFRLFEFLLGDVTGGSVVERVRAPLGLLVATGLAAGYHFAVWRRDRRAAAAAGQSHERTIGRVFLITAADPAAQAQSIEEATGASVTVWARDDLGQSATGPSAERVASALAGVTGKRVLVIAGPDDQVQVIPLAN